MNQAKIQLLLEHIQQGGDIDQDSLAAVLKIKPASKKAMTNYLAAVEDLDDDLEDLEIGGTHFYSDKSDTSGGDSDDDDDDDDDDEDEEKKANTKAPAPKSKKKYRFFLEAENGTSVELEKIDAKSKGSAVVFKEKQVVDMVKVILKDEIVEVDLVALRLRKPAEPSEENPDVSNERLLSIALAAQA